MAAATERVRANLIFAQSAAGRGKLLRDKFKALVGISRTGVIITGGNVDFDNLPW